MIGMTVRHDQLGHNLHSLSKVVKRTLCLCTRKTENESETEAEFVAAVETVGKVRYTAVCCPITIKKMYGIRIIFS